jgi:hypothetical protein
LERKLEEGQERENYDRRRMKDLEEQLFVVEKILEEKK